MGIFDKFEHCIYLERAEKCQKMLRLLKLLQATTDKLDQNQLYNFETGPLRDLYTSRQADRTIGDQTTANLPYPVSVDPVRTDNLQGKVPNNSPVAQIQV